MLPVHQVYPPHSSVQLGKIHPDDERLGTRYI